MAKFGASATDEAHLKKMRKHSFAIVASNASSGRRGGSRLEDSYHPAFAPGRSRGYQRGESGEFRAEEISSRDEVDPDTLRQH